MNRLFALKPLSFWPSLLYFGIPALLFFGGFYGLMPWLITLGWLPFYAYMLALSIPFFFMHTASLVCLRQEGYPLTWNSIRTCFRLIRMDGQDWLWAIGVHILAEVLSNFVIGPASTFSSGGMQSKGVSCYV
ncbi:MAG TPA: hypothetical protein VMS73_06075 [Anaerolineaceae bacterium]|nr:hypothetical protein [Anaerolineaceae bacterium]